MAQVLILQALLVLPLAVSPSSASLEYSVQEEKPAKTYVGSVAADADLAAKYGAETLEVLRYSFLRQADGETAYFDIDTNLGIIRTSRPIDRDRICAGKEQCMIKLDVAVQPNKYFQIIKVTVRILDKNDNEPRFPQRQISRRISESAGQGASISIPTAVDPDSALYSIQTYFVVAGGDHFSLKVIRSIDGSSDLQLISLGKFDREKKESYIVEVSAVDGGDPPKSGRMSVTIFLDDTNDNAPQFNKSSFVVSVKENSPAGTIVGTVTATDKDLGRNAELKYSLGTRTESLYGRLFGVHRDTGSIYVKQMLDYESTKKYHLTLVAEDQGANPLRNSTGVTVQVLDENDNTPKITINTLTSSSRAQVAEKAGPGTFVAHISVIDNDEGQNGNIICTLNDSRFGLNRMYKKEFKITTKTTFDREYITSTEVLVKCRDSGKPPKSSHAYIKVDVKDINDHAPTFLQNLYEVSVYENNNLGDFVVQVNASDSDIGVNAEIKYVLHGDAVGSFEIDEASGIITALQVFNREQTEQVNFRVLVIDQGTPALTGTASVQVTILDLDDESPVFSRKSYSFSMFENEAPGVEVGKVVAIDKDAPPNNVFKYSLSALDENASALFSIDPESGVIRAEASLDREAQSIYYLVAAAQSLKPPRVTSSASVKVYVADRNDCAPEFIFPPEANTTIQVPEVAHAGYMLTRLQAIDNDRGGNAKITFSILSGNEARLFRLDPAKGALYVEQTLLGLHQKSFTLNVQAQDRGFPFKSTVSSLILHINASVDLIVDYENVNSKSSRQQSDASSIFSGLNLTILISVTIVSVFLITLLVLAIVLLKCHERKNKGPGPDRGGCAASAETQGMLHRSMMPEQRSVNDYGSPPGCSGLVAGQRAANRLAKKEVSFNLNLEDSGCIDPSPSPSPNVGALTNCQVYQTSNCPTPAQYPSKPSDLFCTSLYQKTNTPLPPGLPPYKSHDLQDKELDVQQLMSLLRKDDDQGSACSGEMSNTDSGRGASEEGDTTLVPRSTNSKYKPPSVPVRKRLQQHDPTKRSRTKGGGHKCRSRDSCTPAPPPEFCDVITEMTNEEQDSIEIPGEEQVCSDMASDEPNGILLTTFKDAGTPSRIPVHRNSYNECSLNNAQNNNVSSSIVTPYQPSNGSHVPRSQSDNYIQRFPSRDRHGRHSAFSVSADSIAEDQSSTSGSYTINPEDLCAEIDDLFFSNSTPSTQFL